MKKQKRVFASNFHRIGMQLVAAVLCFMDIVCVVFFSQPPIPSDW